MRKLVQVIALAVVGTIVPLGGYGQEDGVLGISYRGDNYYQLSRNSYNLSDSSSGNPVTAFRLSQKSNVLRLSSAGAASYVRWPWGCNCTFMQVAKDDVVSVASIKAASTHFQRVHLFWNDGADSIESDYTIRLNALDGIVYLAFMTTTYDGWPLSIGWVSLHLTTAGVSVEASVIDDDCNSELVAGRRTSLIVPLDGRTWQDDIYVDSEASGEGWGYDWDNAWKSLQDAVRAATAPTTVIHVRPGVYGSIDLDQVWDYADLGVTSICIESTDGRWSTVIDGGGYGVDASGVATSGVWCVSKGDRPNRPSLKLIGFTVRNGLGGVRGVDWLVDCAVEDCHYGLSNTLAMAGTTLSNVDSPLAPGAGIAAKITSTPNGFRVSPGKDVGADVPILCGTTSLTARVWRVTNVLTDSAFMQANHFFTIGLYHEE